MTRIRWESYLEEPFSAFVSRWKARGLDKPSIRAKVLEAVMLAQAKNPALASNIPQEEFLERIRIGVRARLGEMKTAEKAVGNSVSIQGKSPEIYLQKRLIDSE